MICICRHDSHAKKKNQMAYKAYILNLGNRTVNVHMHTHAHTHTHTHTSIDNFLLLWDEAVPWVTAYQVIDWQIANAYNSPFLIVLKSHVWVLGNKIKYFNICNWKTVPK